MVILPLWGHSQDSVHLWIPEVLPSACGLPPPAYKVVPQTFHWPRPGPLQRAGDLDAQACLPLGGRKNSPAAPSLAMRRGFPEMCP